MKRNKLSIFLLTMASGLLLCQNAGAFAIVTEEFANYQTGRLGDPNTGGSGQIPGWNTAQNSITVTNGSGSLDGHLLGLVASAGDRVFIDATNNLSNGVYNKWNNGGVYPGNTTTNINLYYSFLYKFHSDAPLDPVGQRVIQVNKQNSGYTSSGNITHFFLIAKDVAGKVQLGICKEPGQVNPAVTNWASTNINYEDTFFVVIKNKTSGTTSNEVDSLWINPPTNSFGAAEGSVPTANAVAADGSDDTSTTGQGRFFIDSCGQHAEFDELRIANTWADATPWYGQCLAPIITVAPAANVTNVEGLNVTLQITAPCTSPIYQWQISQNNGSTWSNISGANNYSYTTPTLWIATDQHNQYHCVVTSGCNSLDTPATNAATTVTLTSATYTPVGLIMYDTFSDTYRGNTPVTTNNSVWYTTSADTSGLDASTGALIATPLSGTSTLWWCNFLNESNGVPSTLVPVTLNITNAIVVTLPLNLGDMTSFTNNGALRFGLFDYADAGTTANSLLFTNDTTACGGSSGNGLGVRGYALSVDFGTNFTANSPLSLMVRNGLTDVNLIGTTGDFISMDSGPAGGGYTNAPAFKPDTNYKLVLQVTRTDTNRCRLSASITGVNYAGVSTNWSFSNVDTNGLAYHRFDTFAIRPNKLENAPDTITMPYFEVQVVPTAWEIEQINPVTVTRSGTSATLNWTPIPTGVANFTYSIQKATQLLYTNTVWSLLVTNLAATTYTDTSATASNSFYRVHSP